MKYSYKFLDLLIKSYLVLILASCNTVSNERYFDLAVLNCNTLTGFADDGLLRELDNPSLKLKDGTKDQPIAMKRIEVIASKVRSIEHDFNNLKELKGTNDTKEMLHASIALYSYVLPVYKTAYMQLAILYDGGAPKMERAILEQNIHDKYHPEFKKLYDKLIDLGKRYAAEHHIDVRWAK